MAGPEKHDGPDEALLDLLVKRVVEGLSSEEQRALDALDSAIASDYSHDFERAAAAISLAGTPPEQPPAALRSRLEQLADRQVAEHRDAAAPSATVLGFNPVAASRREGVRRASRSGALGWLAAAASLVLAMFGWLRTAPVPTPPVADVHLTVPPVVVSPPRVPAMPQSPAQQRAALLARADSLKVTLGGTKDPASKGVSGDAVWDPATQTGFLHFAGLAANDPAVTQYQIWIFDAERDQKYPVDGGVFDVPGDSAEVVIPIHATLPIRAAKAFAVTVEKPGGVVVSGLAHVVALGRAG